MSALAKAAWLPHLQELRLRNCDGSAPGWNELLGSSALANLRTLDLASSKISEKNLGLLGAPTFAALQRLILDEIKLRGGAMALLLDMPLLRSLQELSLSGAVIDDAWLIGLAALPGPIPLARLDLSKNGKIGAAGIKALARSANYAALRELNLSHTAQASAKTGTKSCAPIWARAAFVSAFVRPA